MQESYHRSLLGANFWILSLLCSLQLGQCRPFFSLPFVSRRASVPFPLTPITPITPDAKQIIIVRGGATSAATDVKETTTATEKSKIDGDDDDDERYSRQVYTLGARAHGLVRSATVYVDGPAESGLVYECVKDLALSGVGNIVLWESSSSSTSSSSTSQVVDDAKYHDASLDDLGNAYQRAARTELKYAQEDSSSPEQILQGYIQRLNPSVKVSRAVRPTAVDTAALHHNGGVILAVDRPYQTQVQLNELARQSDLKFVAVETAGVYGRVFCDFGPDFEVYDSDGETPLVTPLDRVELAPNNNNDGDDDGDDDDSLITVYCIDTEKHDVSRGDKLQFQWSNGDMMPEQCTVVKVLTPHKIHIACDDKHVDISEFCQRVIAQASSFTRIKEPIRVTFVPLQEAMEAAIHGKLLTACDLEKSFDSVRRSSVLSCFQALDSFVAQQQALPKLVDLKLFQQVMTRSNGQENDATTSSSKQHNRHVKNFLRCCAAKLTPLQAMFGAIGAQEALKAVTGLYNPVQQLLLYDCDELLQKTKTTKTIAKEAANCSSGLEYIFGKSLVKRVKESKLFVVGAGAIGCEVLKNLAAMGFATGKKGCISVTDMDTIEQSNLSRQLLFRDADIGAFKSIAAQSAILRFNPDVTMEVHTSKVGVESTGPFDEIFWSSKVDVVLNALDNMEARLFMDQQCVANQKALVDAGTLGSKGNVQVVVPHQSETYGSSVDPPEPAIPVCTLKNFPYAISHTIQWGRDLFDGLYERRPRQANDLEESLSSGKASEVAETLIRNLGDAAAIDTAVEVQEDLCYAALHDPADLDSVRSEALKWAVKLAVRLFHTAVIDLLREHPVDSVDEDGDKFWGGTRKVPIPLKFRLSVEDGDSSSLAANENLIEFVQSAARLRMETLCDRKAETRVTSNEAQDALIQYQDIEANSSKSGDEDISIVSRLFEKFNSLPSGPKSSLRTAEFEKDDESNGHVQFVTAASNLRAICYGIPTVDAMETRRVAGKIVPAMITTTAIVSALSSVELLKLLQKAPLPKYRNSFINLALPFFAFTVPLPAEEFPGPNGVKFTVWDTIDIRETKSKPEPKGLTLRKLLEQIKKAVSEEPDNIEITTISAGQYMVYASFLHEGDKEVQGSLIWDLIEEATSGEEEFAGRESSTSNDIYDLTGDKVELMVTVEDSATGEEYELPPVYIHKAK